MNKEIFFGDKTKFDDFEWSFNAEPHLNRTKEIYKKHPEIKKLFGKNPFTLLIIIICILFQATIIYFFKDKPWWLQIILAFFLGAFASHTLFVTIHEACHNLILKNKTGNILCSILANIPIVMPCAVSFRKYHLLHHAYQGVEELDGDMPNRWEATLINNSIIGKMIWLLLYPVFSLFRPGRLKEIPLIDSWTIVNIIIQIIFVVCLVWFLGWNPLIYLTASFFFSVGLHPLGARWIQEHFLTHGDQETKSYYGVLNIPNLNVGYHNEHHDFPAIPWNKLPQLKKIGGDYYSNLKSHSSYTILLIKFLFSHKISVYSRMARNDRGEVKL